MSPRPPAPSPIHASPRLTPVQKTLELSQHSGSWNAVPPVFPSGNHVFIGFWPQILNFKTFFFLNKNRSNQLRDNPNWTPRAIALLFRIKRSGSSWKLLSETIQLQVCHFVPFSRAMIRKKCRPPPPVNFPAPAHSRKAVAQALPPLSLPFLPKTQNVFCWKNIIFKN